MDRKDLRTQIVIAVLLVLGTVAFYWPVLQCDFVNFDDNVYVYENAHVKSGLSPESIRWAFTTTYANFWHPITWLSHMLDCQLWGLPPAAHHLSALLWHVANVLLLFLVLKKLTGALWKSAAVAALFSLHPLHVESVVWVAERKDLLSTFFGLLSILTYKNYADCKQIVPGNDRRLFVFHAYGWYGLTLLFFALSLMSKPMLVTLPFVLLMLDFWPLKRIDAFNGLKPGMILRTVVWEKTPFFILSALFSVIAVRAQKEAVVAMEGVPIFLRLQNAVLSYGHYLEKMFWPRSLAFFYPPERSHAVPKVLLCFGLVIGLSILAILWWKRRPYFATGWFWFLGTLIPVSGLVQVGSHVVADRYTYVPLIGLFVILCWGLSELVTSKHRMVLVVVAGITLLLLGWQTRGQVQVWKNSFTLYEHALRVTPRNYVAYNNLAGTFAEAGRWAEAETMRRRALAICGDWFIYHNLIGDLVQQHKFTEALALYEKAYQSEPAKNEILKDWGLTLIQAGDVQKGYEKLAAATQVLPNDPEAFFNLGFALTKLGREEEAIAAFEKALALKPNYAEPHLHLGFIFMQRGDLDRAVTHYQLAIRVNPLYLEAYNNLANVLLRQGRIDESLEYTLQVLKMKSDFAPAHVNAAEAFLNKGDIGKTIQHWREAVRLGAGSAELCNNLAWLLATSADPSLRNGNEAVALAERACQLSRPSADFFATLAAAYAEAGRFDEAVATENKAVSLASHAEDARIKLQKRLELYQKRQAYREGL